MGLRRGGRDSPPLPNQGTRLETGGDSGEPLKVTGQGWTLCQVPQDEKTGGLCPFTLSFIELYRASPVGQAWNSGSE